METTANKLSILNLIISIRYQNWKLFRGCPRSVMVKSMDYEIVVCEFELQLHYYIHFRANTLRNFLSLTVFGLLSSSLLLFPQRFGWYVLRPITVTPWTYGATVIAVGSQSFLGGNHLEVWWFNPHYRRVTIQEYLTLVPGYG